jgi:hypothetical protein
MAAAPARLMTSQDPPVLPSRSFGKSNAERIGSLIGDSCIQMGPIGRWEQARGRRAVASGISVIRAIGRASEALAAAGNREDTARLELSWLEQNRDRYGNQWVALDGNRLIAVGNSAREVYAAIERYPGTPLVTKVEPATDTHFAGW